MKKPLRAIAVAALLVGASACCDLESTCLEIEDGTDRNEAYNMFCNAIEIDPGAFATDFIGPDGDTCRCDSDGSTVWDCRYFD